MDNVKGSSTDKNIPGVLGENSEGVGVQGISQTGTGIVGQSESGVAVWGGSKGSSGVGGKSESGVGVHGVSVAGPGVRGDSNNGDGVFGFSKDHTAVHGMSETGTGILGQSESGVAVWGGSKSSSGVGGKSERGVGVHGVSDAGPGVRGDSNNGDGVFGFSKSHTGVHGMSETGIGIHGSGRLAGLFEGNVEVKGNINVTGDVFLANADCAEDFDIADTASAEPGTVMVLGEEGALQQSCRAYDKRVAGVVSGAGDYQPGIILDKQQSANARKPIALLGKVFCKVDAQYGAIEVGDLLTTSETPGHAMKASDPLSAFGAVIGKALRPLREGQALVPILIALQ